MAIGPTLTFGKMNASLRKCRDAKLMNKNFGKKLPKKCQNKKDK